MPAKEKSAKERIEDISNTYLTVVCPYIIQYETLANSFPTEILNEIRAIFTHLSKYYSTKDENDKQVALMKAEGHLARAMRDCYKYNGVAYEDKYIDFQRLYAHVDLSLVNDGTFLPKLLEAHRTASRLMKEARQIELSIECDDHVCPEDLYSKYEQAYIAYDDLHKIIEQAKISAEQLKMKVELIANKKAKKEKTYEILTWVFGVSTIAGLILAIIAFFT